MTATVYVIKKPNRRAQGPDPVDVHVGMRLRLKRNLSGMSQEQLGKASGLTFQQIQKYERGVNRMGASRLYQIAQILGVSVAWFFEDMQINTAGNSNVPGMGENDQAMLDGGLNDTQILQRRETLELIRAYYRITDPHQRRKIYDLVKSMAGGDSA